MGKISKLMKLLSASAVVAGANSVALADCGLCGDKTDDHKVSACPHFDYRGYGLSKGYKPETLPDNDFLGKLALADRKNADAFLNAPKSTTVTFLSDNSDSATAVSESDAEEMRREDAAVKIQNARRAQLARREAARERDAEELKSMLAERRKTAGNLNGLGKTLDKKKEQNIDRYGMWGLEYDAQHRGSEEARSVAEENREKINISDSKKTEIEVRNSIARFDRQKAKKAARKRDREELASMMKDSLGKNRQQEYNERLSESLELSEKRKALENAREARRQEAAKNELVKTHAAANKIQNAARARLARKKAAELAKQEAERNDAARRITEALRANKERKEAQRQAQIDGDYELAKKLQAEYDAEDRQIRADRLLAEQGQLRENLAAVPVEEARNGEDFEYRSERDQINADNLLAQQEQAREYLGMNTQEQSHTTAIKGAGVADEEVETDHWALPQATAWNFKRFDFESNRRGADRWARQLDNLSIRKIECILWLVSTSYQQLQNANKFAPTAQMAEAISDVNSIFPYSGTNSGVMNVYRAFENTDTAEFVTDLERLGTGELDGVLYYVADRYMHLLLSGKKAASAKFIELAKATLEHFDTVWEADEAEIVPDSEDLREAPRDPVNFKANGGEITETEPQETERWNLPYRVYYAYCGSIRKGWRPTKGSLQYHENPELFRSDLRNLSIRRLETVIYLAACAYEGRSVKDLDGINRSLEEVRNIFPEAGKGAPEPNARVKNVFAALGNMIDRPNDNPKSMQPFGKGFNALTTNEQERVFDDMAIAYREKLRNGARPASMAFVRFADEFCKISGMDGFVNGEDTHPVPEFPEFGNEAKAAVAPENNTQKSAVTAENNEVSKGSNFVPVSVETEPDEDSEWYIPIGLHEVYGKSVNIHEVQGGRRDLLTQWGKKLRDLNIRRLEVVMYLAASQYGSRNANEDRIGGKVYELAQDVNAHLFSDGNKGNKRLLNCYHALENKQDAIVEFDNGYYQPDTYEGSFQGGFRRLKTSEAAIVLGEIAVAYREKLREGHRPSHGLFVEIADEICNVLNLDGWFAGEDDEDTTHPIYEEFGREAVNPSAPEEVEVRRNILDDDNRVLVEPVGA